MTAVAWIAGSMLGLAALLALVRIVRGPSMLDRAVGLEVLLSCVLAAIALSVAVSQDGAVLAALVVLAILSFVGTVSIARFAGPEDDDR